MDAQDFVREGLVSMVRYTSHLTERNEVDVVCPDKLDSGTQHQRPEQPLQANSV